MVIMMVTCSQCRTTGTFDIEVKFRPKEEHCKTCHHDQSDYWTFQFCNLSCLLKWQSENDLASGFPCQRCLDFETWKPSGFAGGFKQNGMCQVCKGTGLARGRASVPAGIKP